MAKGMPKAGEWCDTESVMRTLNISERTVQKWAQLGWLKYKVVREGKRRFRLYDERDVEKLRESGPPQTPAENQNGQQGAQLALPVRLPAKPLAPLRRNFTFSLPEGKIMAGFPAELSDGSVAEARSFLELVLRQLPAGASAEAFAG